MQLRGKKEAKSNKHDESQLQAENSKRNLKSLSKSKDNENINIEPVSNQNEVKFEILILQTLKSSGDKETRTRPTLRNTVRYNFYDVRTPITTDFIRR